MSPARTVAHRGFDIELKCALQLPFFDVPVHFTQFIVDVLVALDVVAQALQKLDLLVEDGVLVALLFVDFENADEKFVKYEEYDGYADEGEACHEVEVLDVVEVCFIMREGDPFEHLTLFCHFFFGIFAEF